MRDHDNEFQDNERKYAYEFDYVLRRYIMRALRPSFRAGRALELGCFEGEMTALLLEEFADVTVVEASGELVTRAQERVQGRAKFVCGRFEDVELSEEFDNVFLVHTLEHLEEPVEVLRKIQRWMSPQGRLFLVVPNANAPSRRIAVKMGIISHNAAVTAAEREHGHRITYSFDTLERDAHAAGLEYLATRRRFLQGVGQLPVRQVAEDRHHLRGLSRRLLRTRDGVSGSLRQHLSGLRPFLTLSRARHTCPAR